MYSWNDDEISNKINEITEGWSEEDRVYLNKRVPEEGLQTEFKGKKLISYAKEFFNLSKKGLDKRNYLSKNGEFDESIHMKDLEKNLENGFHSSGKTSLTVILNSFFK